MLVSLLLLPSSPRPSRQRRGRCCHYLVCQFLLLVLLGRRSDSFTLPGSNGRRRPLTGNGRGVPPVRQFPRRLQQQQSSSTDDDDDGLSSAGSSSISTKTASNHNLPDYGTTPVEIDQIRVSRRVKNDRSKAWRRRDLFGNTLVDQTLGELQDDVEFQQARERLQTLGPVRISQEERLQRRRALDQLGIPSFDSFLKSKRQPRLRRRRAPTVLQLNIGLYCNQACGHCHVESSPLRSTETESMTNRVAAQCLELLKSSPSIRTLDITGGAPELNPAFRYLVRMARSIRPDLEIIDRCNLTVLQEPGQEDLVDFLKQHQVRIVASLPCYSAENVNRQRGIGVFERSIAALLALNDAGYGRSTDDDTGDGESSSSLKLDLVYNPLGAFLPPPQDKLQAKYKQELDDNFGILFDSLFTMTNMPIKRFADFLVRRDELKDYMDLLQRNFNPETLTSLMCLDTVSIGFDGKLYDCDFNQQLGYGVVGTGSTGTATTGSTSKGGLTVFDLDSFENLQDQVIRADNHCFGCTAGMGSSCQGTTA